MLVCSWVIRAWDKIKSSTIVNGFWKYGVIPDPATDNSSLGDGSDSEASDTDVDVNEEQLVAAMDMFAESLNGFDLESDDDEWNK